MRSQPATRLPSAFTRLAWSNLGAQSAEQIGLAAAPIVAVVFLHAGAGATGLLQMVQTLPFLLLSIPAGMLADRTPRPRLMAGAEALRVVSLLTILVLAELRWLTLPLLGLLGFIGGAGTIAYTVAAPSLVPVLVLREALATANGRIELARTVAFTAGPALAGVLVGWTGAAPAFGVAAAFSTLAVLLLAGLREPARQPLPQRHPLRDLREVVGFVFAHSLLRPIFVTQALYNIAFFALQAVYVPYAVHRLGLSASGVGATLAIYGVGMVVGAVLAPRLTHLLPFGAVIAIGPSVGLVAGIAMAFTIWMPFVSLAGLSFFLLGCGGMIWVVSTTTLRQIVTPRDLLARVTAVNVLAYGARPLGAAIGALVAGWYGVEAALVAMAMGFAVQAMVIGISPVPRLARQPGMATDTVATSPPAPPRSKAGLRRASQSRRCWSGR